MSNDDIYRDPNLLRIIEAILRLMKIPAVEIEDIRQDVLLAIYQWSLTTETSGDVRGAARKITKRLGGKYWRNRLRHPENTGLTGDADEHTALPNASAIDLIDVRKVLDEINLLAANGALSEKKAAVLRAMAEETTLAEHAAETNQRYDTVAKSYNRALKSITDHLHNRKLTDFGIDRAFKGAGALVAVAIFFLLVYTGRLHRIVDDPTAQHTPPPVHEVPRDPSVPLWAQQPDETMARTLENRAKAADQVLAAEIAFKRMEWRRCLQHVEEAKRLDPTVGDVPDLKNECEVAEQTDANAKGPRRPR